MKYINAAEVLPQNLLSEIQGYIKGELIYIPNTSERKCWGEKSGSKHYFKERNLRMRLKYNQGFSIEEIAQEYHLAFDTVRKIVYHKTNF